MKTTVILEMWDDRTISAYAPEFEGFSLNGQGRTVEEAKESLRQAVEDYKRALMEEGKAVPASLSGVEFDYQYDKASFFRELQARRHARLRARGAEGEDGEGHAQGLERAARRPAPGMAGFARKYLKE